MDRFDLSVPVQIQRSIGIIRCLPGADHGILMGLRDRGIRHDHPVVLFLKHRLDPGLRRAYDLDDLLLFRNGIQVLRDERSAQDQQRQQHDHDRDAVFRRHLDAVLLGGAVRSAPGARGQILRQPAGACRSHGPVPFNLFPFRLVHALDQRDQRPQEQSQHGRGQTQAHIKSGIVDAGRIEADLIRHHQHQPDQRHGECRQDRRHRHRRQLAVSADQFLPLFRFHMHFPPCSLFP